METRGAIICLYDPLVQLEVIFMFRVSKGGYRFIYKSLKLVKSDIKLVFLFN